MTLATALSVGCGDDGTPSGQDNNASPNHDAGMADTNHQTSANNLNNQSTNHQPSTNNGSNDTDCVPNESAWESNAQPFVDEYCGECHGPMPQFGAPMSLTNYDEIVAGADGTRYVDKMLTRLLDRTMPPQNAPQPNHSALDTMVEWASCGERHANHESGLVASRPVDRLPSGKTSCRRDRLVLCDEYG